MAKKKEEEKINLDAILFKCRDILRKARNSGSLSNAITARSPSMRRACAAKLSLPRT